ncbi:MAG: hypothetical protein AAGD10_08245 [Myxococcota bacterium]
MDEFELREAWALDLFGRLSTALFKPMGPTLEDDALLLGRLSAVLSEHEQGRRAHRPSWLSRLVDVTAKAIREAEEQLKDADVEQWPEFTAWRLKMEVAGRSLEDVRRSLVLGRASGVLTEEGYGIEVGQEDGLFRDPDSGRVQTVAEFRRVQGGPRKAACVLIERLGFVGMSASSLKRASQESGRDLEAEAERIRDGKKRALDYLAWDVAGIRPGDVVKAKRALDAKRNAEVLAAHRDQATGDRGKVA